MSVIVARPPNFELILKAFPSADKPGVIFAYGDHIYNPTGGNIPPALLAHEEVHLLRQHRPSGPNGWWLQYIDDAEFRYREELAAHVAEFRAQAPGIDRNLRAKLLTSTAARLCAPLYNYQPPRSLNQAIRDIRQELDRK